jgi:predicted transcriptional regulator
MATMTIRIPDGKHERLRRVAETQGASLNKMVEEWAGVALAQFDAETRFQARAARGSVKRGLSLLNKLDHAFAARKSGRSSMPAKVTMKR